MSGLNAIAAAVDPKTYSRAGFGVTGTTFVWFRRIFRDGSNAPDFTPQPRIVTRPIPGGGVSRQNIGADPDLLTLRVEVDTVADGVRLRSLVGTTSTLTLPDAPYSDDDYGTGPFYPQNDAVYRSQSVFLASIAPEGITIHGTARFTLTFERDIA